MPCSQFIQVSGAARMASEGATGQAAMEQEEEVEVGGGDGKQTTMAMLLGEVLNRVAGEKDITLIKYGDESKNSQDAKLIHHDEWGIGNADTHEVLAALHALNPKLSFSKPDVVGGLRIVLGARQAQWNLRPRQQEDWLITMTRTFQHFRPASSIHPIIPINW